MNKRITAILLCFVLAFTMLVGVVPVSAATHTSTTLTVTADKATATPGDVITYTITLGPVSDMGTMQMVLDIPTGLTYVPSSGGLASGLKAKLGYDALDWTEVSLMFNGYASAADYESDTDTVIGTFKCTVDSEFSGLAKVGLKNLEFYSCQGNFDDHTSRFSVVTADVNVVIPATGISLNKNTLTLIENTNETLIATVSPTNTTDTVVWDSTKDEVATVDTNGNVVAVAPGTATITATAGNFSDECVITVKCSHSGKVLHQAKTDATCQDQNYSAYYLCSCGQYLAEDGTTEIEGVPYTGNGNHSYGSDWDKQSSTETKHYHKCSVCGGLDSGENHTVGTAANCVDKTICGKCDKAYGAIDPNNHKTPTTFNYIKIDENNHKKLYDCCDALAVASEAHIYDDANDMICNGVGCGYDRTHYCGNGTLHSGFAANCSTMTDGEKDYYICSCGKKYYDATCLSPVLNDSDLVIAWKHTLTHHNPAPASCWENGTIEYWSCSKCNKNFGTSNEQDTNALATTVDPATGNHGFGSTWVDGNDGYHYHVCTTTGCTAKDTANRQEHNGGTATCQEKATCTACGAKHGEKGGHTWSDTYELSNADANKHYHICIIAGCAEKDEGEDHTGGTATCEAAKTCSVCTKVYGEKDMNNHTGTATNIVPNNNGTHDIKYTCCGTVKNDNVACSGGTANCVAEAICEHCNTAYGNKNATNHTSDEFTFIDNGDGTHTKKNKCCNAIVGEPEEHDFGDDNICDICNYDKTHYCGNGTLVKGKAATCTENGVKDSYKCSCGKIYLDATCKTLVASEDELVIKATGVHTDADKNNKCDNCEAIIDKTVTSPQTGDNSNIALWIALAFVSLVSLTGLTVYGKKKRNQA